MKLQDNLPRELAEELKIKWDAFCAAAKEADVPLPEDPGIFGALERVFALSDFVAKSCIRDPRMLQGLIAGGELQRPTRSEEYVRKSAALLPEGQDDASLDDGLRRFRRREMVRIAWRDLAGWADLAETISDLSEFADACIDHTLGILYERQCLKWGTPTGRDGRPQGLAVIAMGKLGAAELNFSSDVDLIMAYPEIGETQGGPRAISNEEFFTRLCRDLLKTLGQSTAEGIVFRVDLRLRPYGENGPLVMSFDNMETYYQMQGREWERYAWIKARVAAGDKEAGNRLMERLKPFVYRRYLDFGAFESLRGMKQMITLEVQRKGLKDNVKLGPGGIREIEFFGQIFQLIRGGVTPALQERRIQKVLDILARENFIPQRVRDALQEAYVFLRNTEHRLQEFSDQQTHRLPSNPTERARLAASMGFADWNGFSATLEGHMECVHGHFNNLLKPEDAESSSESIEDGLEAIWRDFTDDQQARKALQGAGFEKPDEILQLLDHLRKDSETRALSKEGRERLDKLMPHLLKVVGLSSQSALTLNRTIELIKAIARRTCYLSLLLENPMALTHLVKLFKASPWIASFVTRHPVILDELLDPRRLYAPPEKAELQKDISHRIASLPPEDLEYQMEELRIFKQVNTLRVAAADVTGILALMKVSDRLTYIAEALIDEVLNLSWNHLVRSHGSPTCARNGKSCERGFAVIAYGKLGGIELGYASDLDLVFLHSGTAGQTDGKERPIDNAQFFARLGQRVIHILTAHTPAGVLYETDMRLRPSGSSGLLVSQIDAFEDYQAHNAWTWEHQALVRARAISGNQDLVERFEKIRKDVLTRPRKKRELQKEILHMRERMRKEHLHPEPGIFDLKQDRGGMVDIEFLVQYLVLLKSGEYPELAKWTDNVRLLQTLAHTGIMDTDTAHFLKEAYLIYRSAAHTLSLQEKPAKAPEEPFHDARQRVAEIWDRFMENGKS